MREPSSFYQGVPPQYRIGLALSMAILAHAILLSFVSVPAVEPVNHRNTVAFELLPSVSSANSVASSSSEISSRNPQFEIPPLLEKPASARSEITSSSGQRKTKDSLTTDAPPKKSEPNAVSGQQPSSPPSMSQSVPSTVQVNSESKKELEKGRDPISQISSNPAEHDPYLIELAGHLGREIERLRIPGIRQLSEKLSLEVELQLLGNGALTRARIIKSTGIQRLDDAIYHASLSASPYPAPPAHHNDQNRFEIELVFSPKRL